MINKYEIDYAKLKFHGDEEVTCRVLKFYKGNKICKNFLIKDSLNAQSFLRGIIYGKLPSTIPYSYALNFWNRNQNMSDVSFGVPSIIEEVVLRVMYRDPKNLANPFAKVIGKAGSGYGDYDYKMVSVRTVCQYASTFSALTFEDFDSMVTTSLNREREHKPEMDSPVEDLFKM